MSFFRHTIDASRVWLFIYIAKRFWLREPPSKGKETRFRRRRPGKRLASSFVSFDDRETPRVFHKVNTLYAIKPLEHERHPKR